MKKVIIGGVILIVCTTIISAIQLQSDNEEQMESALQKERSRVGDYKVTAMTLPKTIDFAGESVPMQLPDVQEKLDRELLVNTYWQSNGILLIKRAHKFFPIIEPILAQEGVPDDFKYLAVIESGLTNVVSPAGASGFWQIMSATARELELEVNENVDERYHLEKATRAACVYLKKSKEDLGSWTLAAAAYNAGIAGIRGQLDKQQVDSYYDLYLNSETGRYMYRLLAIKEILNDPTSFGFQIPENTLYPQIPTKIIRIEDPIEDLAAFAKANQINYKLLKIHNPWLREGHLNNASHKMYDITIPL
jgi:hypothetical protein